MAMDSRFDTWSKAEVNIESRRRFEAAQVLISLSIPARVWSREATSRHHESSVAGDARRRRVRRLSRQGLVHARGRQVGLRPRAVLNAAVRPAQTARHAARQLVEFTRVYVGAGIARARREPHAAAVVRADVAQVGAQGHYLCLIHIRISIFDPTDRSALHYPCSFIIRVRSLSMFDRRRVRRSIGSSTPSTATPPTTCRRASSVRRCMTSSASPRRRRIRSRCCRRATWTAAVVVCTWHATTTVRVRVGMWCATGRPLWWRVVHLMSRLCRPHLESYRRRSTMRTMAGRSTVPSFRDSWRSSSSPRSPHGALSRVGGSSSQRSTCAAPRRHVAMAATVIGIGPSIACPRGSRRVPVSSTPASLLYPAELHSIISSLCARDFMNSLLAGVLRGVTDEQRAPRIARRWLTAHARRSVPPAGTPARSRRDRARSRQIAPRCCSAQRATRRHARNATTTFTP